MPNKVNSKSPNWDALAKTMYRHSSAKQNIAIFFNRFVKVITFRFVRRDKIIDLFQTAVTSAPPEKLKELNGKFFTLFQDAKLNRKQAAKVLNIGRTLGIAFPAQFETLAISKSTSKKEDIKHDEEAARIISHVEYVQKLEAKYLVIDVPANGNCFFYSLAHQVYPEMIELGQGEKAMLRVREELSAYMNQPENKPEFFDLLDEGIDFETYIASIGRSSSGKKNREGWGGEPELVAASRYYERPLKKFFSYGHENRPNNLEPFEIYGEEFKGEPIHMLFNGVNHWEAMIPLDMVR